MMLGMSERPPLDSAGEAPSPQLVAAWLRLGTLDMERVPMWAAHWLVNGFDGPVLAELAGLRSSDRREARDLLPGALSECGVPLPPSRIVAAMTIFADLARRQQSGQASERWVVERVQEVLRANDYANEMVELPLGQLCDLDDEYSGGWGRTDEDLAEIVRAVCVAQLQISAAPQVLQPLTATLWRPAGSAELALVAASGWMKWPPRLADQPIFYPVLNRDYAIQIARDWNVVHGGSGYVTEFEVRMDFLDRYDVQQVGGRTILEYWIPASDLAQLNANIVGLIRVVDRFRVDTTSSCE